MQSMPEEVLKDNPLVIVGDEDTISGFVALGFKAYAVKGLPEVKAVLDEIVNQKAAVCLLQDNFYSLAEDQINSYKHKPLPIFVPFAKAGESAYLDNMLKEIRLKATGAL